MCKWSGITDRQEMRCPLCSAIRSVWSRTLANRCSSPISYRSPQTRTKWRVYQYRPRSVSVGCERSTCGLTTVNCSIRRAKSLFAHTAWDTCDRTYCSTCSRRTSPMERSAKLRLNGTDRLACRTAYCRRPLTRAATKTGATSGFVLKVNWACAGVQQCSNSRSPSVSQSGATCASRYGSSEGNW